MRQSARFSNGNLNTQKASLALLFMLTIATSSIATAPFLEKTDVFRSGEQDIALYRIPGIVVTTNGTVLLYCEARRNSKSDWADSEVFLRRSTDGGLTFDAARKIAHFGNRLVRSSIALARKEGSAADQTVNNPVAIVDHFTGAVHFIYCVNYERCFYLRSEDDGVTFSKPIDITAAFEQFRPEYDCRVIATGPGHGIQLKNGRLVVPVWLSTGQKGHSPSVSATIFSDDHGRTWARGAIALPSTDAWPSPNETAAVELADGSVMLNVRTGASSNRRVVTTSPDGITNWTRGHFDEALLEPICMASLVRYSFSPPANKNRILFSNPDNLKGGKEGEKPGTHRDRKNLSIKLSYDEGKTWAVNKVLEAGPSAYSDLAVVNDGTILCFYECPQRLVLARFNLEWLTDGKDSVASSPDFLWEKLPAIPDAEGFAGSFVGTSGGALVVAGGANIMGDKWGSNFEKRWYDSVFILEQPNGSWRSGFKLPHALGYGVSITTSNGLICIGGSDAARHYADVFRLCWADGKMMVVSLPSLPEPCANCCGAMIGDIIYVAGGIETPDATSATKNFWSLDLAEPIPRWMEQESWPGPGRMLAVAGVHDGSFFLFSGVALKPDAAGKAVREYLRDAYAFTPGKGWRRLADLPQAVAAAPSPATSADGLFIFSGDDGTRVNRAPGPEHPGFSHTVLPYDVRGNKWTAAGVVPFSRATTSTVEWHGHVVVPMGESRPRERTTEVWWAKPPVAPTAKTGPE